MVTLAVTLTPAFLGAWILTAAAVLATAAALLIALIVLARRL